MKQFLVILALVFMVGCIDNSEDNDTASCPTCPGGGNGDTDKHKISITHKLEWCDDGYQYTFWCFYPEDEDETITLNFGDDTEGFTQSGIPLRKKYTSCGIDIGSGGHLVGWPLHATAPNAEGFGSVNPCATCSAR